MTHQIVRAERVIVQHSSKPDIKVYYVGFEDQSFRLDALVDVITSVIPEFVFGPHVTTVQSRDLAYRVREAAKRLYDTERYKNRGEFGEIILHLLLRDFIGTNPLLSKIYFKDSLNSTVHGFDGVHILVKNDTRQLWLGESKLYEDGSAGVKELAADIIAHFEHDYLRNEFLLISNRIAENAPEVEHWKELLHKHTVLKDILDEVWIPCACTYTSTIYGNHVNICREFIDELNAEVMRLQSTFNEKLEKKSDLNIVLMLFPVKSKEELVRALHERVRNWRRV